MIDVLDVFKLLAVLVAAILLGNWFLTELKKARLAAKPWYAPYLSLPGALILLAILTPVFIRLFLK